MHLHHRSCASTAQLQGNGHAQSALLSHETTKQANEEDNEINTKEKEKVSFCGSPWTSTCVICRCDILLRFLQLIGFYPGFTLHAPVESKWRRQSHVNDNVSVSVTNSMHAIVYKLLTLSVSLMLKLVCALFVTTNVYFAGMTMRVVRMYIEDFGAMHVLSICAMITGLKPCINAVVLAYFLLAHHTHCNMWNVLERTRQECSRQMSHPLSVCKPLLIALGFTVVYAFASGGLRLIDLNIHYGLNLTAWQWEWTVPVTSLGAAWSIVPIVYFVFVWSLMAGWCSHLRKHVLTSTTHSLKQHFTLFLELTSAQNAISKFFGPWIFLSFSWYLSTLCLTIYFLTNSTSFLEMPTQANMTDIDIRDNQIQLYMNVVYSVLQISLAIGHVLGILMTGIIVNERTIKITEDVLKVAHRNSSQTQSAIYIQLFQLKLDTQKSWGVSVWKAVLLKRYVLFTILSLICTYAVLLTRFRDKSNDKGLAGQTTSFTFDPEII